VLENTKCIGVELVKDGEHYVINANIETVLSAGTFDTPRILMLSGIGSHQLLHDIDIKTIVSLPGVGENLHDHPTLHAVMFEYNEFGAPPIALSMAGSGIHWKSEASKLIPDLMFLIPQFPLGSPAISEMYPPTQNTFSIMPGLMQPASRGYVKMLTSKPGGPLEIQPNYLAEPEDLAALVKAVEIAFELAEQPPLKKIIKRTVTNINPNNKKQVEEFVRNAAASYWHPVGTCAMGKGPEAVVDNLLRVHGVENLRIADASVMPDITSGGTNAPTFMIGEFAAKAILSR
jgi:choline dehydrogenase